jgi:hypothetical protein
MATDVRGRVESPVPVDAGHLQIETDAVVYARASNRAGRSAGTTETWRYLPTTLKLGLLDALDLETHVEPQVDERHEVETPEGRRVHGAKRFGDVVVRLKWNVKEGFGGRSALALLPFASLRSVAAADYGLIVPFAMPLTVETSLGATARVERVFAGRHHTRWSGAIALARPIRGPVSGFLGMWGATRPFPGGRAMATLDLGLRLGWGSDLEVDAGVFVGLGEASDDLTAYAGWALRR